MRVHSYGAGVQSRRLLHLYLDGDFQRPDMVIFADTLAEPQGVYQALEEDKALCHEAGIGFVTVSQGDLRATNSYGGVFLPAFTRNGETGKVGQLRRQCTHDFKVAPIRRELRKRGVTKAELWLGISTDEIARAKPADVKWLVNRWPLIELGISRHDCLIYLERRGLSTAKSACTFCPYRSGHEWQEVKSHAADWQQAVDYDRAIRDKRMKAGNEIFVHKSCVPLDRVPLEDPDLQPGLWDNECEGMCGV